MSITVKQLRNVAEELIDVLGLIDEVTEEPIIIQKKATEDEIVEIIKNAVMEMTEDDEISEGAHAIINELIASPKKKTAPTTKGKKAPIAVEIEEEYDDDIENEINEVEEEKPAKKESKKVPAAALAKGKKVPVVVEEEKPAKVKAEKKEKVVKEKKLRERNSDFATALEIIGKNPWMSLSELRDKMTKKGADPKSNGIRNANLIVKRVLELLEKNNHITKPK